MPRGRPPKPGFEKREARAVELLKLGFKPTEVMKKIKDETQVNMGYYRIIELAQEHGLHDGKLRAYTKREQSSEEISASTKEPAKPSTLQQWQDVITKPTPQSESLSPAPDLLPQVMISRLSKAPSAIPEEIRADVAVVGKSYKFAHNPKFSGKFVEMIKGICYFDTGVNGSKICIGRDELVIPAET